MVKLDQPAQKILVIGGSTLNPATLGKIQNAINNTNFLNDWAIIFVNHRLFKLYNQAGDKAKIRQELAGLNTIFIDEVGNYQVNQGSVYILPDPWNISDSSEWIHSKFTEQGSNPTIEASNSDTARNEDDDWLEKLQEKGDDGIYLPCIDKIMTQVAYSQVRKFAGLLLCGTGLDGAYGLLEMYKKSPLTAVQIPSECINPRNNTDSMPKAALKLHSHQEVSLEQLRSTCTLTDWLCSIKDT